MTSTGGSNQKGGRVALNFDYLGMIIDHEISHHSGDLRMGVAAAVKTHMKLSSLFLAADHTNEVPLTLVLLMLTRFAQLRSDSAFEMMRWYIIEDGSLPMSPVGAFCV
jgi:hypothetical protein